MSKQFHQICEAQAQDAVTRCGFQLGQWEAGRSLTFSGFFFIEFIGESLDTISAVDRVEIKEVVGRVIGVNPDELSIRPSSRGFYIVNLDMVAKAKEIGKSVKVPSFKHQAAAPKPQPKRESWLDYMPEI